MFTKRMTIVLEEFSHLPPSSFLTWGLGDGLALAIQQYEEKIVTGEDYGYDQELESILVGHIQEVVRRLYTDYHSWNSGVSGFEILHYIRHLVL